tara:strand:- start:410 stop:829 length:420 start_codon:yes stop_codon:yes gene_type:complete
MITKEQVLAAQDAWGNGIVAIGKRVQDAREFVNKMYVAGALFKPTMAKEQPFRIEEDYAVSYFVGGCCAEDSGFALKPWSAVRFVNADIIINGNQALAMGHYFFTNNGEETMVEYSFGYALVDGELKINLHHSSLPCPA